MMSFPMPNDTIDGRTVVASCWYRDLANSDRQWVNDDWPDQVALVLLLNKEAPFFTVAHVGMDDHYCVLACEERFNIVEAVEVYQERGGDI